MVVGPQRLPVWHTERAEYLRHRPQRIALYDAVHKAFEIFPGMRLNKDRQFDVRHGHSLSRMLRLRFSLAALTALLLMDRGKHSMISLVDDDSLSPGVVAGRSPKG